MTMKEFCKQAGKSRQTITDWLNRGFIEKKLFGNKLVFSQEDLANVPSIQKTLKQNQHKL